MCCNIVEFVRSRPDHDTLLRTEWVKKHGAEQICSTKIRRKNQIYCLIEDSARIVLSKICTDEVLNTSVASFDEKQFKENDEE